MTTSRALHLLALALPLTLLAACAGAPDGHGPAHRALVRRRETATLESRLVLTYDGGVQVLDASTLETSRTSRSTGSSRQRALPLTDGAAGCHLPQHHQPAVRRPTRPAGARRPGSTAGWPAGNGTRQTVRPSSRA